MFVDKDKVYVIIPSHKSAWNALYKSEILLKIPFYKTKF